MESSMRMRHILGAGLIFLLSVLLSPALLWAGSPEANSNESTATFRIETAEVHLMFSAFAKHNEPVTVLSSSDFVVLQDGRPVDRLAAFESLSNMPVEATLLTDVSDSMRRVQPFGDSIRQSLAAELTRSGDGFGYQEFGAELGSGSQLNRHLTSFFDSAVEAIAGLRPVDSGRRALIIFSDGDDNYSLHSVGDVIAEAQRKDVAIYAVMPITKASEEKYLTLLAEQTGGRFFAVRKADDVRKALADIEQELRSGFLVTFRPPVATPGMHRVAIRPNLSGIEFYYRTAYFEPNPQTGVDEIASTR